MVDEDVTQALFQLAIPYRGVDLAGDFDYRAAGGVDRDDSLFEGHAFGIPGMDFKSTPVWPGSFSFAAGRE
jgi:hypothetical protein